MVFSSITFLFYYLPITGILVLITRSFGSRNYFFAQNIILTVMSLIFYAWGEPVYILLMIGSIFINFYFGKIIGKFSCKERRRIVLALAVSFNLCLLVVFKYSGMITELINLIYPYSNRLVSNPEISLPIGISFFTFQAMSYVIDVYKKEVPVQRNILDLGLYISFFPQLIAGPIVRYHDINKQLSIREITKDGLYYGIKRFTIGMAKKILIANVVAQVADDIFSLSEATLTTPLSWLGICCYTIQIYFDFSGYSDMAIGLGRMFGFKFQENFNHPYIASGIQDFWRRWHISLSTWFRDYLYIPLGGSRKGAFRTYLNQLTVFLFCGLWHGASWTFVFWGLFHGFFLTIEKLFFVKYLKKSPKLFQHIYTLLVIMMGWVLFRAETFEGALYYLKSLWGFGAVNNLLIWKYVLDRQLIFVFFLGIIFSTPVLTVIEKRLKDAKFKNLKINPNLYNMLKFIFIFLLVFSITTYITSPQNKFAIKNTDKNKTKLMINSNSNNYQIFYKYPNENFNEENSIKFDVNVISIPSVESLNAIRVDADNSNLSEWIIDSITIQHKNSTLILEGKELFSIIKNRSSHLGNPKILDNNSIRMEVYGRDPYFTIGLPYPWSEFESNNSIDKMKDINHKFDWYMALAVISILGFFLLKIVIFNNRETHLSVSPLDITINGLKIIFGFSIWIWIIGGLAASTYNPFIYFRF